MEKGADASREINAGISSRRKVVMRNNTFTTLAKAGTKLGRIAALFGVLLVVLSLAGWAGAQSTQTAPAAAPAEKKFSGCVQPVPTDKDTLVLSGDTVCAKLTGKFAASELSGHQVELNGVLTPRTTGTPASIEVGSVASVGKSCSDVCALKPPGTRGLGKGGQTPGKEGGTPGLTSSDPSTGP
jgi:hypothetical protein